MKMLGIKLVTGEEIFGQAERTQDGRLKLTNPVAIRMVPSQISGGQPNMAFVPFPQMMCETENTIYIEPLHIVYQFVPFKQLISE